MEGVLRIQTTAPTMTSWMQIYIYIAIVLNYSHELVSSSLKVCNNPFHITTPVKSLYFVHPVSNLPVQKTSEQELEPHCHNSICVLGQDI